MTTVTNNSPQSINTSLFSLEKFLFESIIPIGFVYVQFPDQESPETLWPFFKWTEITKSYKGAFFRAEGGDAKEFGKGKQEEGLPDIKGELSHIQAERGYGDNSPKGAFTVDNYHGLSDSGSGEDRAFSMTFLASKGEIDSDGSYVNNVYGKSNHVTPVNYSIKIWKRKA